MSTMTRTTNPNGTYRYELDGKVIYQASKVLYTHVTHYVIGDATPILFHKTERAAGNARGYAGWVKTSVAAIVDGDAAPAVVPAAPRVIDQWETYEGETYAYDIDGNRVIEIGARTRPSKWNTGTNVRGWSVTRSTGTLTGQADGLRAAKRAALAALAQLDARPAPEPRTPPRVGARVLVNDNYTGSVGKGRTGKVDAVERGDDGNQYVTVDFGSGFTWIYMVHELTY